MKYNERARKIAGTIGDANINRREIIGSGDL